MTSSSRGIGQYANYIYGPDGSVKKYCKDCDTVKELSEFIRGPKCRLCKAKYLRELYQRKRPERLAKANAYRKEHWQERLAYKREYAKRPEVKPILSAQRRANRLRQNYGDFKQAVVLWREIESILRVDPAVCAAIPERRHKRTRNEKERLAREEKRRAREAEFGKSSGHAVANASGD